MFLSIFHVKRKQFVFQIDLCVSFHTAHFTLLMMIMNYFTLMKAMILVMMNIWKVNLPLYLMWKMIWILIKDITHPDDQHLQASETKIKQTR